MVKKAYIQDLCGDENPIDIDCAILQCMLQDAIFEALMSKKTDTNFLQPVTDAVRFTLPVPISYVYCNTTLK